MSHLQHSRNGFSDSFKHINKSRLTIALGLHVDAFEKFTVRYTYRLNKISNESSVIAR